MKRFFYILSIPIFIFIISTSLISSVAADCKDSQVRTQKFIKTGFVTEMRNGYREWYVDRAVWSVFNFSQKEQAVFSLSSIREKCDGYISIKVYDGHTGKLLAKRGPFGIKIYN